MTNPIAVLALSNSANKKVIVNTSGTRAGSNATIKEWKITWGDGKSNSGLHDPPVLRDHEYAEDGDYKVSLRIQDTKNKKAQAMIIVRISPIPVPLSPVINTITPSSGFVDFDVDITGSNFGAAQGSSTVTFNGVAASIISWSDSLITATVPTTATTGPVIVTVGGLQSNGVQFTVTIEEPITLDITNSDPLPDGVIGVQVQIQFEATGGTPPYQWGISGNPPAGITFSSSGLYGGTPTTEETTDFTITVSDNDGNDGTKDFTHIINSAQAEPLMFLTASVPSATVGQFYSKKLEGAGGTLPYTFSLFSGSLPPGLSLAGDTIQGTPTASGTFNFQIKLQDNAGQQVFRSFTIGFALVVETPSNMSVVSSSGNPVSVILPNPVTSGGTPPYSFDHTPNSPATLAVGGPYNIQCLVADSSSPAQTKTVSWSVSVITQTINVTTVHPRLHILADSAPAQYLGVRLTPFRARIASGGPLHSYWQTFVTGVNGVLGLEGNVRQKTVTRYITQCSLVFLGGHVPGIDYGEFPNGTPLTYQSYAAYARSRMLEELSFNAGLPPWPDSVYNAMNHPVGSPTEFIQNMARAHDWLIGGGYAPYTATERQNVAAYLVQATINLLERIPAGETKPYFPVDGKGAFGDNTGGNHQSPWYAPLVIKGDGYFDENRIQGWIEYFNVLQLTGGWTDSNHYHARGFGGPAYGSYHMWYMYRNALVHHGWKTATGQDYFNIATPVSPDAGYFKNYPLSAWLLKSTYRPKYLVPMGQSAGDLSTNGPEIASTMFTGMGGVPAADAMKVAGGSIIPANDVDIDWRILVTCDPTVTPSSNFPYGIHHSKTYGMIVDKRSDGTHLIMAHNTIKPGGAMHTWGSSGGSYPVAIPFGFYLAVNGTPVFTKHVSNDRNVGIQAKGPRAHGQCNMRFYDPAQPLPTGPLGEAGGTNENYNYWTNGGLGKPSWSNAVRVDNIVASDALGGITGYTPGTGTLANPNIATALTLHKHYQEIANVLSAYQRIYKWGTNHLRIIDDWTVGGGFPNLSCRWMAYTGLRIFVDDVEIPIGAWALRGDVGSNIKLKNTGGTTIVTWTIPQAPSSYELYIGGGPSSNWEWIDDLGGAWPSGNNNYLYPDATKPGALALGDRTIMFKSVGSGDWEHLIQWV